MCQIWKCWRFLSSIPFFFSHVLNLAYSVNMTLKSYNKSLDRQTVANSKLTELQQFSDFLLAHDIWVVQNSHIDPRQPEIEVGKIRGAGPPKIQAPVTPGESHGTKNFWSKFFSYHPLMILFYGFCGLVMLKMPKIKKNCLF